MRFDKAITFCLIWLVLGAGVASADPFDRHQYGLAELAPGLFQSAGVDRRTGCLATALYYEARGESYAGRMAVARVILNRVAAAVYPPTICGVVWQNAHRRNRCQFSFTCDGRVERPRNTVVWKRVLAEAKAVLCKTECHPPFERGPFSVLHPKLRLATHYHGDYVNPSWGKKLARAATVGRHIFYISERVTRTMKRAG